MAGGSVTVVMTHSMSLEVDLIRLLYRLVYRVSTQLL